MIEIRSNDVLGALLVLAVAGAPALATAKEDVPACSAPVNPPDSPPPEPEGGTKADGEPKKVGWVRWNDYQTNCFTTHLSTEQMLDFTVFGQDAASISQLGRIDPQFQWREAKVRAQGKLLCFERPWSYKVEFVFGGFDLPQGQRFGVSSFWLEIPLWGWTAAVRAGQVTSPFSLQILEAGGHMTFMERSLAAFDIGNQTGIIVSDTAFDERLTWTAGVFGNWVGGGTQVIVAARGTGLPLYEEGGRHVLHLELSGRYVSSPDWSQQVQARPATNVGPYFADTGPFQAIGSWGVDVAFMAISGPLSLQAEILETHSPSSQSGNPNLWGWYVTAAWFLTGETRPYDRRSALPGYPVPLGKWGAVQVAGRYFTNSLTSGNVDGGVLRDLQAGLNWYIGAMFRVDFNYGHVWLKRFGTVGNSDVFGFRLQFQI